jgi:glycosyltransferase involved in cell wall biosynthesis
MAAPSPIPRATRLEAGRPDVVHVLPHAFPLGGTERSVLDLLESPILADLDQRVVFLRGGPLGPFRPERVLALSAQSRPNVLKVLGSLRRARPRLIHGWLLRGNLAAAAVGLASPHTVVLTSERNLGHNVTPTKRLLERLVAHREDMCVVNSNAVRDSAAKRLPRRRERIRVIRPGIPEPPSVAGPRRVSCVAVGRLEPMKDYETLLGAWSRVLERHPNATLAILGDGSQRAKLESIAHANGLRGSVLIAGDRDPNELLRGAELFVSTSRSEGFSRAMLEALATGTPIVATAVGGALELPTDAVRFVPVANPEATAGAIADLLDRDGEREVFGAAARAAYSMQYTLEHCHLAYRDLYSAWLR